MPRYEVAFILRALEHPAMSSAIKSVAALLMENRAVIRKIENLGEKALPYRMRAHANIFSEGRYVLMDAELPAPVLPRLRWKLGLEENVIRSTILAKPRPPVGLSQQQLAAVTRPLKRSSSSSPPPPPPPSWTTQQ